MKGSFAASFGLHAAILAAALVALPNPKHEVMPVEAITVDISNIADANKLMATAKDAEKPVEKPAPKKAETVRKVDETLKVAEEEKKAAKEAKAPPPEPEPEPEPKKQEAKKEEPPPPDPDAMAALLKKTIEEPPPPKKEEPKKKAEETPKPVKKPEKQPEKKVAKLDTKKLEEILNMDSLLDKENDEKTTNASEALTDGEPAPGERDLQGKDQALSATTISAFVQRIRECWVIPPGAREGNITVKVRIQLNQDGSVAGAPQIMNGPGDFLFDTTARSTVAAILSCADYDFLPQDQYDVWKELVLNFNPNMFADATPTQ
jgi:outer membrane biosynthesis protein TonB